MSYLCTWKAGAIEGPSDRYYRPCFAHLKDDVLTEDKLTVWLTMSSGTIDPDERETTMSLDYSPDVLYSSRLTRLVNYWIHIGKLIGLKFDNLEWSYDINTHEIRFVLDLSYLNSITNKRLCRWKLVHLHLFFLRLLNERHATVMMLRKYHTRLRKMYPKMALLTTVMLAEKHCGSLGMEYDFYDYQNSKWDAEKKRFVRSTLNRGQPDKKLSDITGSSYAVGGHYLFTGFPTERLKSANKIKDLFEAFMEKPWMTNFDSSLLRVDGEERYNYYPNIFEEAKAINERKKKAVRI